MRSIVCMASLVARTTGLLSLAALASLAATGPAAAQHMYRCGNTFSQQPCGADAVLLKAPGVAQPIPIPADTAPENPAKTEEMKAKCRTWILNFPEWKDRDSVKITSIVRGKLGVREVHGTRQVVRSYYATVNGKNSFGAYAGEKTFVCYANETDAMLVDLYQPGDLK